MEERKNSNVVTAVIITLMAVAIIGLVGFIVYDKIINKTNEPNTGENNNDKNNDVIVDYDLSEAKKIIDKYYIEFWGFNEWTIFDDFDEKAKICIAEKNINENLKKYVDCTKTYGQDDYQVESLSYGTCWNGITISIAYEDFNKIYQDLFYDELEKKDVDYKSCIVDYNESNNEFIFLEFQGGGDTSDVPMYEVLSAKLTNNNNLTIEVGYVVFECETTDGYLENESCSPDFDKNINYTHSELEKSDFSQQFIKQNSDKVKVLTFNFIKENDKFVLNKMEA